MPPKKKSSRAAPKKADPPQDTSATGSDTAPKAKNTKAATNKKPATRAGTKRKAEDEMDGPDEDTKNQPENGTAGPTPAWKPGNKVNRDDWSYDVLLEAACQPLAPEEIKKWAGWCELESEPSFFNVLLSDIGVRNVKVQEIYSLDDDLQASLPQPVFGLVFLSKYFDEVADEENDEEGIEDVWFANQTIDDACGTIAMMNIVMNCPQIELGSELEQFKDATKSMSYPLVGQALGANDFIRAGHNSLARRIDLLNSDLLMGNNMKKFNTAKKRKTPAKKKQKKTPAKAPKKRKISADDTFHYVAYVVVNGFLWELDGLNHAPVKLGPIPSGGDLVSTAGPHINARIAQFEEGSIIFNMMAVCRSPLATVSKRLAQTVVHLRALAEQAQGNPELADLLQDSEEQPLMPSDQVGLQQYGLTAQFIKDLVPDADISSKISDAATTTQELHQMYKNFISEQKLHLGAHRDEGAALNVDIQRVGGRRQDNLSLINKWVAAIAAHDKLEELIKGEDGDE